MMYELEKIKNKWRKSISQNEKKFNTFFNTFNKLENKKFIEYIEEWWQKNEEIILVFNESFNFENNMKTIENKNAEIENEWKINIEKIEIDFKENEKAIIEEAIKKEKEKLNKILKVINQSELANNETQTEINEEENNSNWQEQKINEQNKIIKKLENKNADLLQKINLTEKEKKKKISKIEETFHNQYYEKLNKLATIIEIRVENLEQENIELLKNYKKTEKNKDENKLKKQEIKLANLKESKGNLEQEIEYPNEQDWQEAGPSRPDTSVSILESTMKI